MIRKTLIVIAMSLSLAGCSSDGPDNGPEMQDRQEIALSRSQQDAVTSQHEFAVRLFQNARSEGGNSILSPLSASMALSMVANGAQGATLSEISTALGLENASLSDINDLNRILIDRLPTADNYTTLKLLNSLWIDSKYHLFDDYRSSLAEYYQAPAEKVDLYETAGMDRINKWVSEASGGKINSFLSTTPEVEAAVINSIYFKSVWSKPFMKNLTKKVCFNNESGSRPRIYMMGGAEGCPALIDDGVTVVRISYGNRAFHFTAVLPPENVSIADFISGFDAAKIDEWNKFLDSDVFLEGYHVVNVNMPRFSTVSDFDLIPALEKMGVKNLFNGNLADLSKMSENRLFIKMVKQRSSIDVDEDGAVVVTATEYDPSLSIAPAFYPDEEVTFDRPFLYYISEYSTGAILFIGNVSEL